MSFMTIHTNYGLQELARAESTGKAINLTHMAVGDGGGNAVTPSGNQIQLVRERYRAVINRVYQAPDDPLRFTAELVIPASVGGFTLREVGVFDSDGSLFVVGNLPATYKPQDTEGAYADTVVRLDFMVSNANTIALQIDPNVVVVTQQWISNNVTAGTLIPGGTTGQVLAKVSNSDGDVHWIDPTQANVVVDTVAEKQILAAGQTNVDLTKTITYGLAVYIEGVRLTRGPDVDDWQPDETLANRVILGKSYPEGTKIECVNNEPAGSAPAPLERSKNLADVADKVTSRNNLDVYSKAETYNLARQQAPAGMVAMFARNSAPTGWLKANGAAVSRTAYADLFSAIGTTFGEGDGATTFNVPDLRGEFIRAWDDARDIDTGRALGSWQGDQNKEHTHNLQAWRATQIDATGGVYAVGADTGAGGAQQADLVTKSSGGSEARPRNVAMLACIKF
ncbi:tail protein [Escherichia phage vB_EcoM_ECO1230-10]|uniref:Putative phage tail protein n=1 Tax=Escherichia phage vB_EcoM_ECO1230-10 TaxID=669875 RepID=D5LGZ0_9CAUD|nr:tail protein [Escherichia phage vB_EcoM_ECO1230-10]ADE87921.1 putative phage tail protein [Escherichia phage vB_EcoM_ECO1230-10]